ncbi:MAG: sulfotransferase family protein [Mesorhizobium sp.]|nr:MAG: sulfotransferase family protein [Mesorhizobium sp.]
MASCSSIAWPQVPKPCDSPSFAIPIQGCCRAGPTNIATAPLCLAMAGWRSIWPIAKGRIRRCLSVLTRACRLLISSPLPARPRHGASTSIVHLPGVVFDLIGKTETFARDFERVLDHVGASEEMRRAAMPPLHTSSRRRLADYFTPELADTIYRAYERDFDQFGYPRALPE